MLWDKNVQKVGIEPIYCIQSADNPVPPKVGIVAYEPIFAIGTGNPDSPENVQKQARAVKTKGSFTVIYGGSVAPENVQSFITKDLVDGVLVGATNSLDPAKFTQILETAHY